MWASHVDQERLQRVDTSRNQWHRDGWRPESRATARSHPTEEVEESDDFSKRPSGTWGEADVGGFDHQEAAAQFEELRRNLTQLSKTRTKDSSGLTLRRTRSGRSGSLARVPTRQTLERPETGRTTSSIAKTSPQSPGTEEDVDLEAGEKKEDEEEEEEDLELDQFLREGHFEKRSDGASAKKVGVIFKNLTVKGTGSTATFVRTLPDAILGTFGPDLYHVICRFVPALAKKNGELRTLVHDFTGCVRDGEVCYSCF